MRHEPHEIHAKTSRANAVRRAQQLVMSQQGVGPRAEQEEAFEQAFAELPAKPASPAVDAPLMQELTDQLRLLDAQREHLAKLLEKASL